MSQHKTYPVSEAEILKISKLITAFEDALKEILRLSGHGDDEPADLHEIDFFRQVAKASDPSANDQEIIDQSIF